MKRNGNKIVVSFMLIFLLTMGVVATGSAAVINFDDLTMTDGAAYGYPNWWSSYSPSLNYSDVTFTMSDNTNVFVSKNVLGDSYDSSIIYDQYLYWGTTRADYIATFSSSINVQYVKVGFGDLGGDLDKCYLEAYNSSGSLIGTGYNELPYGSVYQSTSVWVSVTTTAPISYVKFYSRSYEYSYTGQDGQPVYYETIFPNSAHTDNFTYEANAPVSTPEPVSVVLLGLGLMGLAGIRRKLKA